MVMLFTNSHNTAMLFCSLIREISITLCPPTPANVGAFLFAANADNRFRFAICFTIHGLTTAASILRIHLLKLHH